MPLSSIRSELANRIGQVKEVHRILSRIDDKATYSSVGKRSLKGLIFVNLYAIIEYTVYDSVSIVLQNMSNLRLPLNHFKKSVLSIALNGRLDALNAVGSHHRWERRYDLFKDLNDNTVAEFNNSIIPTDGRNITDTQLQSIWKAFSIQKPIVPEPRLIGRLREITEHRRAIAHGRLTPEQVGSRFSVNDLKSIINDANDVTNYIVDVFSDYLNNQEYA